MHSKFNYFVKELNHFYLREQGLWELDHQKQGFEWIDPHDFEQSVISFIRYSSDPKDYLIIVCNFTPVVRNEYRIGVPQLQDI
ncbi:hypothetical protein N752_11060 [Desulforamulus aquiferis]|nr:hypothetical protein N752_11060 [Desulforamulus aquiferis]